MPPIPYFTAKEGHHEMEFNNYNGQTFAEYVDGLHKQCQEFLEFCESVKERYFADKDVEAEMLKKQNDLLHTIELDDLNYHGIARIGKEIRELRRNRRGYKNDYLMNEPIKELAKDSSQMEVIERFVGILTVLSSKLKETEEFIYSQKYNKRSSVENISEMKREDSDEEDNRHKEDIIILNRVLSKYAINVELGFDEHIPNLINAKLQLENHFSIKSGKKQLQSLAENIEKYYRPGGKQITCDISTSDMCLVDDYNKNTLSGEISILIDGDEFYKLHIIIRSGKKDAPSSKKGSKKKGKKRK